MPSIVLKKFKSILRQNISEKYWNVLKRINKNVRHYFVIAPIYTFYQWRYNQILRVKRKKEKITVAFFIISESVWKTEELYRLLERDGRFNPVMIICPYIPYGEDNMLKEMNGTYGYFHVRGYNVFKTYKQESTEWLDVKKEISPDIIFFFTPHNITRKEYYIKNFNNCLNCYVPYTFQTTYNYESMYNRPFHYLLWKAYYQTKIHKQIALKHASNKAKNVIVSGYPGIDVFLKASEISAGSRQKAKTKKSVIWAPHHTIEGEGLNLNFSNFLQYHEFIIEIAKKYRDSVYLTFKPHPILRSKLNKEEIWGRRRTDEYYKFWKESDFCDLNEGNYDNLFLESDAMIHDSDSFLGEYLALNKPVLYTRKDDFVEDRQNDFGKSAMKMHYQARNEQDIIDFIANVVIKGKDTLKDARTDWVNENLTPPESKSASMNIFLDIKESLHMN